MTAREVAKWHGKACIVTLKQGSVLVCDNLEQFDPLSSYHEAHWGYDSTLLYPREIKSIEARKP